MSDGQWGLGAALWLGILTSISPCPLAGNIAATAYLGKKGHSKWGTLISGFSYALGRALAYSIVAIVIIQGLARMTLISSFLQQQMNQVAGPILILAGMGVLGLLELKLSGYSVAETSKERLAKHGVIGALLLGFLLAFAFCPVSAALFFGGLMPLMAGAIKNVWMAFAYGVGSAIPVLLFAGVLSFGVSQVGKWFQAIQQAERWMNGVTGGILILAGVHLSLRHVYQLY